MPPRYGRDAAKSNQRRRLVRGAQTPADWSSVDAELIRELIASVSAQGGAVSFGYTRDGGAFTLTFLDGGERYTEVYRPSDDLDEILGATARLWTGEAPTP